MSIWQQLAANGLISGSTYGLVALGFSLIYGVARFFHFAHGAAIVAGAYVSYALVAILDFPPVLGLIVSVLVVAVLGASMESAVYRPLRRRNASALALLVASLGMYVLVQNVISVVFGDNVHMLTPPAEMAGLSVFGARITRLQATIFLCNLALYAGVGVFVAKTRLGRTMRAVACDSELAEVVGVDRERVMLAVFALGSALAAVAGILYAYDTSLTPTMGFRALLFGVVAAIAGGIGSIPGAVLGGFLVGFAQHFGVWKLPTQWQDALVFAVLLVFLLLRPQGFFGTPLKSARV